MNHGEAVRLRQAWRCNFHFDTGTGSQINNLRVIFYAPCVCLQFVGGNQQQQPDDEDEGYDCRVYPFEVHGGLAAQFGHCLILVLLTAVTSGIVCTV